MYEKSEDPSSKLKIKRCFGSRLCLRLQGKKRDLSGPPGCNNDSYWIRLSDGIQIPFQSRKILKLTINYSPTNKTFAYNVIIL